MSEPVDHLHSNVDAPDHLLVVRIVEKMYPHEYPTRIPMTMTASLAVTTAPRTRAGHISAMYVGAYRYYDMLRE